MCSAILFQMRWISECSKAIDCQLCNSLISTAPQGTLESMEEPA